MVVIRKERNGQDMEIYNNKFSRGLIDGLPIGLGYLSVSFAFGILVISAGYPTWVAIAISMSCVTSAGQVAGFSVMACGGSLVELALTQLVINLRYGLMSISLSQKLHSSVKFADKLLISFMNTDEVFAVASCNVHEVGKKYMLGLSLLPYVGWTTGTILGAVAGGFLPDSVRSALGIAIFGMFIAIVMPQAKKRLAVTAVAAVAAVLSCLLRLIPIFSGNSSGFVLIIAAVAASVLGALLFPVENEAGRE